MGLQGHKVEKDVGDFVETLYRFFQELNPGLRPGHNGLPYYEVQDEAGRGTGIIRFNFSRRQLRGNGSANVPPAVQDAQGNPWPHDVLIGNGSICKVGFTVWRWNPNGDGGAGIGLELEAVRVISHSEYVAPPPTDYSDCFGGPEPGFLLTGNEPRDRPYGAQFPAGEFAPTQAQGVGSAWQGGATAPSRQGATDRGTQGRAVDRQAPAQTGSSTWGTMSRREVLGRQLGGPDGDYQSTEEVPF